MPSRDAGFQESRSRSRRATLSRLLIAYFVRAGTNVSNANDWRVRENLELERNYLDKASRATSEIRDRRVIDRELACSISRPRAFRFPLSLSLLSSFSFFFFFFFSPSFFLTNPILTNQESNRRGDSRAGATWRLLPSPKAPARNPLTLAHPRAIFLAVLSLMLGHVRFRDARLQRGRAPYEF